MDDKLFNNLTLLASLAALLIAILSWRAAAHANRAALFDRRFEVYADAQEFIDAWIRRGRPEIDLLPKLIGAWQRSHFLFKPAVTRYLRKVWVDAVRVTLDRQIMAGEAGGDRDEALQRSQALTREHTDYERLRNAFLPHLKVEDGYLSLPAWPKRTWQSLMNSKRPWLNAAKAAEKKRAGQKPHGGS